MGCTEIPELLNEAACPALVGADTLGLLGVTHPSELSLLYLGSKAPLGHVPKQGGTLVAALLLWRGFGSGRGEWKCQVRAGCSLGARWALGQPLGWRGQCPAAAWPWALAPSEAVGWKGVWVFEMRAKVCGNTADCEPGLGLPQECRDPNLHPSCRSLGTTPSLEREPAASAGLGGAGLDFTLQTHLSVPPVNNYLSSCCECELPGFQGRNCVCAAGGCWAPLVSVQAQCYCDANTNNTRERGGKELLAPAGKLGCILFPPDNPTRLWYPVTISQFLSLCITENITVRGWPLASLNSCF